MKSNHSPIHHLIEEGKSHVEGDPSLRSIRVNGPKIPKLEDGDYLHKAVDFVHTAPEISDLINHTVVSKIPPELDRIGVKDTSDINFVDHESIDPHKMSNEEIYKQLESGSADDSSYGLAMMIAKINKIKNGTKIERDKSGHVEWRKAA